MLQVNYQTKKAYREGNQKGLAMAQENFKFKYPVWATFLQYRGEGLSITKGERGFRILAVWEDADPATGKKCKNVRKAVVFNLDQTNYDQKVEAMGHDDFVMAAVNSGEAC